MKKLIDIFSGCGGLSYGFEQTGQYKTVLAIDIWDKALNTVKTNKPNTDTLCQDMRMLSDTDILQIKEKYKLVDIVVGGPPCQGFSLAGKRKVEDERNSLWKEYIRFVSIVKPEWIVFENVFGLLSMKDKFGKKIIDSISEEFQRIGYTITINSISAKNFNVAQDRKRIIIIGNLKGHSLKLQSINQNKLKTVRDVIGDLDSLESGMSSKKDPYHFAMNHNENHIKWLKPVPEGKSAHDYKEQTGMNVKGYSTTYKRIWWDRPSPAITTCFNSISSQNNVHPRDNRAITIREAMRIQSFPDTFIFEGSIKDIRTQIGNAVPPELGRQIALQILGFNLKDY